MLEYRVHSIATPCAAGNGRVHHSQLPTPCYALPSDLMPSHTHQNRSSRIPQVPNSTSLHIPPRLRLIIPIPPASPPLATRPRTPLVLIVRLPTKIKRLLLITALSKSII